MAVRRVLASLSLVCLQHSVSAADEFCMVQKNTQLNLAPLDPEEHALMDDFKLAFGMMHETLLWNLTKEEWNKTKTEFLLALKNKGYLATMYMGLKNWTGSLASYSGRLVREAQNLMGESRNATTKRAYFLLEHYSLLMDDVSSDLAGSTMEILRTIIEDAPPSIWRNHTHKARGLLGNLTKEKVSEYLTGTILRPQTKEIFNSGDTFCQRFLTTMAKNANIDTALSAMVPGMKHLRDSLPLLAPAVQKRVPEVQTDFMRLTNISLDALSKSFGNVNLAFHLMIKVMMEVSSTKLNCTMPPPSATAPVATAKNPTQETTTDSSAVADATGGLLHSGAPAPRGLSSFAAAAALAAAAWLAGM